MEKSFSNLSYESSDSEIENKQIKTEQNSKTTGYKYHVS